MVAGIDVWRLYKVLKQEEGYIRELDINDPYWDEIVASTTGGYVYYMSNYLKAFQDITRNTPVMFLYESKNEREINVFFKRDIAKEKYFLRKIPEGKYFDLISPYGYGGYIGNCTHKKKILSLHHEYCKNAGYISEVVKFHPLANSIDVYTGKITSPFHNVVRDLSVDLETIWKDFKPKVRKNVKRAQKYGLRIMTETDGNHLEDFLTIYYKTMKRNEAEEVFYFSKDFFDKIISIQNQIIFFYVLYEGHIISTELVLYDEENCYSYLGGTDSKYYEMRPNDYLKYEIIKWGCEKKLKNFILGGGHGTDDGIFQYKAALAPNGIYDFYVGTDIFCEEKYQKLCDIRKMEDPYFNESEKLCPAYRF